MFARANFYGRSSRSDALHNFTLDLDVEYNSGSSCPLENEDRDEYGELLCGEVQCFCIDV